MFIMTFITHTNSENNTLSVIGGMKMRKLAEGEVLSLTALLKFENDGLALSRAMQSLITDDELKKISDAGILAAEGRIKGIQQFINENGLTRV
jgi:hypothetical protein